MKNETNGSAIKIMKQQGNKTLLKISLITTSIVLLVWAFVANLEPSNGAEILADFGITISTPYFDDGTLMGREPIEITTVAPNSPLAIAGVESGDCILDSMSVGQFHRLLLQSKSEDVTLRLVPGGDGVRFRDRPIKNITLESKTRKADFGEELL